MKRIALGLALMLAAPLLGNLGPEHRPVPEIRVTTSAKGHPIPCPECY